MLPVLAWAGTGEGTVAARAWRAPQTYSAYARVEPITVLKINASRAGFVAGLRAVPGEAVAQGALLGRLVGAQVQALLARRRAAATSAEAALASTRQALAAAQQNREMRLVTRVTLAQARASVVRARAALDAARARLSAARSERELRAPVAGRVLALEAADGERLKPGTTVLTLQPVHDLWLRASFYGAAARAVRRGMVGRFTPAEGGVAVSVHVRSIYGTQRADGAREVGLLAMPRHPVWWNGEAGTVTLEGTPRTLVAVPTRALILDRGQWWVLVRGVRGERRRAVTPGSSRGQWTVIEHGLAPGTRVVVENAYLEFHRGVARHYQPPD